MRSKINVNKALILHVCNKHAFKLWTLTNFVHKTSNQYTYIAYNPWATPFHSHIFILIASCYFSFIVTTTITRATTMNGMYDTMMMTNNDIKICGEWWCPLSGKGLQLVKKDFDLIYIPLQTIILLFIPYIICVNICIIDVHISFISFPFWCLVFDSYTLFLYMHLYCYISTFHIYLIIS